MMEPSGEPGTLDGLQGPDSRIPSPRGKRLDGAISSTIIGASARSFPGPELGEKDDSCSHTSSVTGGEVSPARSPYFAKRTSL